MIIIYRFFAPKLFIIEIIFALSNFEKCVVSKVSSFIFDCPMPQISPVDNIQRLSEKVEYVAVVFSVILCDCGHDGFL